MFFINVELFVHMSMTDGIPFLSCTRTD